MEDLHSKWGHRWLSPKTEVKKSNIVSVGVFAKERINKGEVIRVTGGLVVPKSDAEKYTKLLGYEIDNVYMDVHEEFLLAPTLQDLKNTATINHSCQPNVGFLDNIVIIAIRDIEAGEEITWDYAFSQTTFKPFECKCGSEQCRKIINPNDWKIKEIQESYGEYYSPFLKRKF